jgi:hypothetical protein
MDSMTKQRREGEANRPTRAKTGQRKLMKPNWTEFVRLTDQAVVAFAGADMINRAEPRACGCSRRSRRLDTKWPEADERQLLRQTKPRKISEGHRRTRLASSRTGYVAKEKMWRRGPERRHSLGFPDFLRHILFASYKFLRKPINPFRGEGPLCFSRSGASQRAKALAFIFRSLSA